MKNLVHKLNHALLEVVGIDIHAAEKYLGGSPVVVNDIRYMAYNPDTSTLPRVVGFQYYEPIAKGLAGLKVAISHVVVKFKTNDGDTLTIAVPTASVRRPAYAERVMSSYNPESITFSGDTANVVTRSIKRMAELMYGIVDNKFYDIEIEKASPAPVASEPEPTPAPVKEEPKPVAKTTPPPLLDWDLDSDNVGFDDAPPVAAKAEPKPVAVKEEPKSNPVVAPSEPVRPTKVHVPKTKEELLLKAQQNIGMLDREAGIQELDGAATRVAVDAKQMILCRADLNQLVPFKYEWAWQAYLKATEHHWMPMEINLDKDIKDWKTCTPDESKLIVFALYSLEVNGLFKTNDSLLALYRTVTNPEARQYILRQRFELTVWGNFVNHLIDNLEYKFDDSEVITASTGDQYAANGYYSFSDKEYLSYFKRDVIGEKQRQRHAIERYVGDPTFDPTASYEDRLAIVARIVARYISFGFTYNYASILQLSMLVNKDKFLGISQGARLILRDLALHTSFGILVINNILSENPDLLENPETVPMLVNMIRTHADNEIAYMDWWANSDLPSARSSDQIQTLKYMLNRMADEIGLPSIYDDVDRVPAIPTFVAQYDSFVPSLHGGGSSVVSSAGGGGALSW